LFTTFMRIHVSLSYFPSFFEPLKLKRRLRVSVQGEAEIETSLSLSEH
jgi:hypothetical protein